MIYQLVPSSAPPDALPPLPISPELWQAVANALQLSPQQTRIVELILRNLGDKQIAERMGLKKPTVRDYLDRIFNRVGVRGRVELVIRILAETQRLMLSPPCPSQ